MGQIGYATLVLGSKLSLLIFLTFSMFANCITIRAEQYQCERVLGWLPVSHNWF